MQMFYRFTFSYNIMRLSNSPKIAHVSVITQYDLFTAYTDAQQQHIASNAE